VSLLYTHSLPPSQVLLGLSYSADPPSGAGEGASPDREARWARSPDERGAPERRTPQQQPSPPPGGAALWSPPLQGVNGSKGGAEPREAPPSGSGSARSLTAGMAGQTWQWREGRLLAYELVLGHLVRDHAANMLHGGHERGGDASPPRASAGAGLGLGAGLGGEDGPRESYAPGGTHDVAVSPGGGHTLAASEEGGAAARGGAGGAGTRQLYFGHAGPAAGGAAASSPPEAKAADAAGGADAAGAPPTGDELSAGVGFALRARGAALQPVRVAPDCSLLDRFRAVDGASPARRGAAAALDGADGTDGADGADGADGGAPLPPPPRTKWTRRVLHPVLIGHAASSGRRGRGRAGGAVGRGAGADVPRGTTPHPPSLLLPLPVSLLYTHSLPP